MEENFRYFAILDSNNVVINSHTYPINPEPILVKKWEGEYVWIYDGNMWNPLNLEDSFNTEYEYYTEEDVKYVDQIIGDPQEYLNSQFSNPQQNEIVINRENLPTYDLMMRTPENTFLNLEESHTLKEFSLDKSITNNIGSIGHTYDEELNAFLAPEDDLTYNLNFETFEWEPDLNLDYDLHGDGIMYRWDGEDWILSSEN